MENSSDGETPPPASSASRRTAGRTSRRSFSPSVCKSASFSGAGYAGSSSSSASAAKFPQAARKIASACAPYPNRSRSARIRAASYAASSRRRRFSSADALLQAYSGAYVIESFNPAAVNWYKENRPEVCRGQLSWWPQGEEKPSDPAALAKEYAAGALIFDWISRPDFVAYDWHGGNSPQVRLARFMGAVPVSWTVRSRDELAQCDDWFDHHIFEAFVPDEQ